MKETLTKEFENGYILGIKSALLYAGNYYNFDYYEISQKLLDAFHDKYQISAGKDKVFDAIVIND
ncbi:MAG: hypothetical protein LUG12_09995 [Erysipelotrichaceae bacterium]|nr:hypothetical protein [Erysipelotrichaceae bacterium]